MPLDLSNLNPQQIQLLMSLLRGGGQQPGGLPAGMPGGMTPPPTPPPISPQAALLQRQLQNPPNPMQQALAGIQHLHVEPPLIQGLW